MSKMDPATPTETRGVAVVLLLLVVVVAVVLFFRDPAPTGEAENTPRVAPVTLNTTATTPPPDPARDATEAARLWWRSTCDSTLAAPQPQRYADHRTDMTDAGWASVAGTTAQPVEWTCSDVRATAEEGAGATTVIVYLDAMRRISGGNDAYPVATARRMELVDGRWLVGAPVEAN